MQQIVLDGAMMTSRETAQRYLAEVFRFPSWYGGNLDALFDLLTAWTEPIEIQFINSGQLDLALGSYANALRRVFADAATQNPRLTLLFSPETGS